MKSNCIYATILAVTLAGLSAVRAEDSAWTTNDTEAVWTGMAAKATRITTAPRFKDADAEGGEGILEAFGTKYLPNAYALYQAKRENAKEKEATLKENFPNGKESDSTGGGLYDKVAKGVAKAVFEMDRRHDELCYYYLLHKAGVVKDAELSEIDSSKICVMLSDMSHMAAVSMEKSRSLTEAERTFASKYMPQTIAGYDRLSNAEGDGSKVFEMIQSESSKIDALYRRIVLLPLETRLSELRTMRNKLADMFKQQKLLHSVDEVSAAQLAELDDKTSKDIQAFEKRIPVRDYVRVWLRKNWSEKARISLCSTFRFALTEMIAIPHKDYQIGKYEVTQALWETVMGNNPSDYKRWNHPVENVSWNDCQEFLQKLNAMPAVKASRLRYRLPTADEWEYACRAGGTGKYCKLADGTEVTSETLGEVAWSVDNSGCKTHPIGRKKSNAFGLFDMHGNVWEWTQTAEDKTRVTCGGGWYYSAGNCESSYRFRVLPSRRDNYIGFRLCASVKSE